MSVRLIGEKARGGKVILEAVVDVEEGFDMEIEFGSGFKSPPAISGHVPEDEFKQVWFRGATKKSVVIGIFHPESGTWTGGAATVTIEGEPVKRPRRPEKK